MRISEHAAESAFWEWIDDGPDEDEQDRQWWLDHYGDAERRWKE